MSSTRLASYALSGILLCSITLMAAPSRHQEEVAKYTKQLKTGKDAKAKIEALNELARLGSIQVDLTKSVVPDIFKMLDDKDATIRGAAAHTIGKLDPENKKEVVDKLTQMIKEEKDEPVRANIAKGLAAMGPDAKDALPAIREAMSKADKKQAKMYRTYIDSITGKTKN